MFTYDIIAGIGGSHAHGLSHEDSDEDIRGVFSASTFDYWTFEGVEETKTTHAPDSTRHELMKFLRLSMKGNPDVIEIFGYENYTSLEDGWGQALLSLQDAIFAGPAIRSAYSGYANQKYRQIQTWPEEWFGKGEKNKAFKESKHFFRLLETGTRLLGTGAMEPKVDDPAWYLEYLPTLTKQQILSRGEDAIENLHSTPTTKFRDKPDVQRIEKFVRMYRRAH